MRTSVEFSSRRGGPSETKQQREQEFHDAAFSEHLRERLWGFYEITGASTRAFRQTLIADGLAGKRILEFGSGATAQAFFLASEGAAHVTGIDISPVAVEQGRQRAAAEQLEDRVRFQVMDAESIDLPDSAFDVVCGSSVLHHLDLESAYSGIARLLSAHGVAVFVEPLGHNPLINAYRRRTPTLRTIDEHPLLLSDFDHARVHFGDVRLQFFHLSSLAAIPLRKRQGFKPLLTALDGLDRQLFRLAPSLQRHAWMVVMRMAQPIKPAPAREERPLRR